MENKLKKLLTILTTSLFLFLTVLSATASDLSEYPKLFFSNGNFDGSIVVGDKASAEDVIGAVDIATGLLFSYTNKTGRDGESVKIESSNDNLNIGDKLSSVKESINGDDLPILLRDLTFVNDDNDKFDYTQKIILSDVKFELFSENDYLDGKPSLGIFVDKNELVLTYVLDFKKDADDFEDTTIEILGEEYDIVEETSNSLTLMAGTTTDILEQNQVKTYTINDKDYEVDVIYIYDDKVKFKVNGRTSRVMKVSDTFKIDSETVLGVREVLEEEAGEDFNDQVEFWIGAKKILLDDEEDLEINDITIEDIYVDIIYDGNSIDEIRLEWIPDDELFITNETIFPGLESFKIVYLGLTTSNEEVIKITAEDDDILEVELPLEDGIVKFDLVKSDFANFVRYGGEEELHLDNSDIKEDDLFIITNVDDKETHIIEITDIDDDVSFRDISTDEEETVDSGDSIEFGNIEFSWSFSDNSNNSVNITAIGTDTFVFNVIYTVEGMKLNMGNLGNNTLDIVFEENDGSEFNITLDASEVEVSKTSINLLEDEDRDIKIGYVDSDISSKIELTTDEDQEEITITHYGEESCGNLFLVERYGSIIESEEKSYGSVYIGAAKLASEVFDYQGENLIIVGGPCANQVSAIEMNSSMGSPGCYSGFEVGKGIIRLVDTGKGKNVLLVAGMSAMDTRIACRVLAEYDKYDLSGDEVITTGTSLDDMSVSIIS